MIGLVNMRIVNMTIILLVLSLVLPLGVVRGADKTTQPSRTIAQEAKVIIHDTVYRLEAHTVGHRIMFKVHAGIYYLKSGSKYYDSILSTLKSSRDKGEAIKIKADATSMEIEELIINTK